MAANKPVTMGLPLAEGDYATGTEFVVQKSDGTPIATQWNELATWRTDGSILHGVCTFLTPDAGSNSGTYRIVTGTTATGTAISKAEIVATAFDAVISVTVSGTVYSISANALLDEVTGITPRKDYTHFAGPICSSYCVGHPLLLNGSGAAHPSLQGHFEVRAYKTTGGAVDKAYVVATLENTACFTLQSTITGDVLVTVGGSTLKTFSAFAIGGDYRFTTRGWWGTDPSIYTALPTDHLESTKLIPNYRDMTVTETRLNTIPQSTEWYQRNVTSIAGLDSGGTHPEAAPLSRYDAEYILSGDKRAFNQMRAFNDEMGWCRSNPAFLFCFNARDENTGYPVNMATYTDLVHVDRGYSTGNVVRSNNNDAGYVIKTDQAHAPAVFYTEYLATAEFHLLEGMQFWATCPWYAERPGGQERTWPRQWYNGQVRSVAWGLRNMVNAAICTPSSHPLKTTLDNSVGYALDSLQTDMRPLDLADSTGLMLTDYVHGSDSIAISYPDIQTGNPNDVGTRVGLAAWMDDWLTWSIGFAYNRGYSTELDASGFWSWKSQTPVSRFGTTTAGYCWEHAAPSLANWAPGPGEANQLALGVRDTNTGAIYTTWPQIFDKHSPGHVSCAAPGSKFASNFDIDPEFIPAQIGPALALSVDLGVSGAPDAWVLYDARDISDWGSKTYLSAPEWQIVPRAASLPSWYPAVGAIAEISSGTTIGSTVRADVPVDYGSGKGSNPVNPSDYDDIVDPYSGGALIYLSGQPYLVVYGGGHGDCAYNGIVKFGPLSGSGSDNPTWTLHLAASAESAVRNGHTYLDGRQSSNHTYNHLVGVDSVLYNMGTDGEFDAGGLSPRAFKFTAAGVQTELNNRGGTSRLGGVDYYDGDIYYFGPNISNFGGLLKYSISGDSWTTEPAGLVIITTGDIADLAVDTTRGTALAVSQNQATYYTLPAMTRATGKNVPTGWTGALEYDPDRDAFVSYQEGSATVRELDAASLAAGGNPSWTTRTFSGTPPTASVGAHAVYGRFRYVPELKGYIVVEDLEGSVYFYRSA